MESNESNDTFISSDKPNGHSEKIISDQKNGTDQPPAPTGLPVIIADSARISQHGTVIDEGKKKRSIPTWVVVCSAIGIIFVMIATLFAVDVIASPHTKTSQTVEQKDTSNEKLKGSSSDAQKNVSKEESKQQEIASAADIEQLQKAIDDASGLDLSPYTEASAAAVENSLAAAQRQLSKESSLKSDVNSATKKLKDSVAKL